MKQCKCECKQITHTHTERSQCMKWNSGWGHWLCRNRKDQVILGTMNRAWLRKSNVLIHTGHQSRKKQVRSRTVDTQMSPDERGILRISNQPHFLGHDLVLGSTRKNSPPCGSIWGTPIWVWTWSDQKDNPHKPVSGWRLDFKGL